MIWRIASQLRGAPHISSFGLLVALSACASPQLDDTVPRVAGAVYRSGQVELGARQVGDNVSPGRSNLPFQARLTLGEAIGRTLRFNPALKAASLQIQAQDGDAVQASFRSNPGVEFGIENFAGTGGFGGASAAEETLSVSQVIELGGKRAKRISAAELNTAVAEWEYESIRLRAIRETAEAFVDVLAIQKAISRARRAMRIARDLERVVVARVNAGELNPIEIERTRPVLANAAGQLNAEQARLEPAKRRLANNWGDSRATFHRVSGRFSKRVSIPSLDQIVGELQRSPDISRWSEEIARRKAIVELETARAVPDLTLGAGVRRFNETDDVAFIASASIDLPIFNRNGGNIAAAKSRLEKGTHEREEARNSLRKMLLTYYEDLASSAAKVRALADKVVPSARKAFQATQSSFQAGAIELTSVLDARRVLYEAEFELVQAQAEFEKAKIRIEGLTGRIIKQRQEG